MASVSGLVLGLIVMVFCLFLSVALPTYLTDLTPQAIELLKIFLLTLGVCSIFILTLTTR